MSVIAIDVGSSAVRAAVWHDGRARMVPTPDGTGEIPAAVAFTKGSVQIGRNALGFAVTDPRSTVRDVKRWLERGGHGRGELEVGGERKDPVAIAALVCKPLLELAERDTGEAPTSILLPRPVGATEAMERALDAVADALALPSVGSVPEPLAAAVGTCPDDGAERVAMLVDVGATHTTIAVVALGPGRQPELLQVDDEPIGGDAVDEGLVARIAGARLGSLDPGLREMLRQHSETSKKELAATPSAAVPLPPHFVSMLGVNPSLVIDAHLLADAASPLLRAIDACAGRVRGAARLPPNMELYLVGGMTRLPLVRERIEQALATRGRTARGAGVVALGGAILARSNRAPKRVWGRPAQASTPSMRAPDPSVEAREAPRTRSDTAPVQVAPSPRPNTAPVQVAPAPRPDTAPVQVAPAPRPDTAPVQATPPPRPDTAPMRAESEPAPVRPDSVRVWADTAPLSDARDTGSFGRRPAPGTFSTQETAPVRTGVGGAQLDKGTIRNPHTPQEMLELPIARPVRESHLEPIALPLLLLVTGHARRTGTLSILLDGADPIDIPFLDGRPMLSANELQAVIDCFKRESGSYEFDPEEPVVSRRRLEHRASALVIEGLRRMLRSFRTEDVVAALGERMDRAPYVGPRQQQTVGRLGLTEMERRMVKFSFNGQSAARAAVEHSALGKQSALLLLFLLSLYELVEWRLVEAQEERSVQAELEARAQQFERSNHFQVLGVHWSAMTSEIRSAYERLKSELLPGTPAHEASPKLCLRMLERIEEAYRVLGDDRRRIEYRRLAYPDVDFQAVEDFVDQKRLAFSLREDGKQEVMRLTNTLEELARSKAKKKRLS